MTSQLMTLREASTFLGWEGRWAWRRLLRTLQALERNTCAFRKLWPALSGNSGRFVSGLIIG